MPDQIIAPELAKLERHFKHMFFGHAKDVSASSIFQMAADTVTLYDNMTRLRMHSLSYSNSVKDAMNGAREKCLQAGREDYLNKPLKREQITEILRKWIKPQELANTA